MFIEIVSYLHELSDKVRLELTNTLINTSTADILLFPGHSVSFVKDIESLRSSIDNCRTEVVFELQNVKSQIIRNCLYRISKGVVRSMFTNQLFSQSLEIENNYELGRRFLHELQIHRMFEVHGFKILIIQCGEINILKNIQSENNRVEFRLSDDANMGKDFLRILGDSNIILNPIHTPMGNQGKMEKRRVYLSQDSRYYFSTSNSKADSSNLDLKSLQYAYCDGLPIIEKEKVISDNYVKRTFEIKKRVLTLHKPQ